MSETRGTPARVYLEGIIDRQGLTTEAVDAFADELAVLFACPGPQDRALSRLALESFIRGWHEGYNDSHDAGVKEGRDIERLGLKDAPPAA